MPNYLANRCFNSTSEMSAFAVDSTDEDGLGPFVVPIDPTSYKVFTWRKNSTATIDSETIYAANGPGRWIALSLDPVDAPIVQFVDINALKAYTTPSQGYLYSIDSTPPSLYSWDVDSTATESGTDIVKLTALATGRMYKMYPVSGGSLTTVSSDPLPVEVQATGSTYVWTENGAVNSYDSVITYYSNGTAWIEVNPRIRVYAGTPDSLTKTPNSAREQWIDTTTGTVYTAFSGGWVVSGGAS